MTKADLIKEAREKRTIYEHQEEEEGTQKVRNLARYGGCYCAFEGQRHERPKTFRLQSLVQSDLCSDAYWLALRIWASFASVAATGCEIVFRSPDWCFVTTLTRLRARGDLP